MKKIKLIEIESSSFFKDKFKINFSEKLNCIMGGRGTGKSTLLHMIQSCLDNKAEFDKTTYSILKNNLGEGKITLHIEDKNGKNYKIIKTFNEEPQPYLLPGENFISLQRIEDDIECDIYKAAAIEEIGMNGESRLALIDKMLSEEVKNLMIEIEKKQIELSDNAHTLKMENARVKQLEERVKEYENIEQDLESHKKAQPEDINPEEKLQFEKADKNEKIRSLEKRLIEKIGLEIQSAISNSREQIKRIMSFKDNNFEGIELLNIDLLQPFIKEIREAFDTIIDSSTADLKLLESLNYKINDFSIKLNLRHQAQQNEFINLKQKFEKHKMYYNQYNKLSQRANEKLLLIKDLKSLKENRDGLKEKRKRLVSELHELKKNLFTKRSEKIKNLNERFSGAIKIVLTFSGITDRYEEALQKAFRGSGMRYNVIIPNIVRNFTPDKFAEIVHSRDYETLKNVSGIDRERSEDIFNLLYESDSIYEIEGLYCPDLPEFYLKIDKKDQLNNTEREHYKKTEELSTGQRCTTILPIIFAVSENPLLIDQPEDNLDNKYITESIHKIIRSEKEIRQLIFITHNPNIPVLSDAEHNLFLTYVDKQSGIDKEGNVNSVKMNILNLLEGGKEAFDKRKELYGI